MKLEWALASGRLAIKEWNGRSGWDPSLETDIVLLPHPADVAGAHPSGRPGSGSGEMNGMRQLPFTFKLVLCQVAEGSSISY